MAFGTPDRCQRTQSNKLKKLGKQGGGHVGKRGLGEDTKQNANAYDKLERFQNLPSSSLIVGIVGAWEAGVGRVDAVAGVFCGVGAVARSSTRLFLMNCSLDIRRWTEGSDKERVDAESGGRSASQGGKRWATIFFFKEKFCK